jgi:hypothetical protein
MITKAGGKNCSRKGNKKLRKPNNVFVNILILKYFQKRVVDIAVTWPIAQYFIIVLA